MVFAENTVKDEMLASNKAYMDEYGSSGDMSPNPSKKTAILTCMDSRMDPGKFTGMVEGDAHIIRNAGGRASDDAIRSLIISHKLMGTDQWFVIHHTECGMARFDNETMGRLLCESLETAVPERDTWKNVTRDGGSPIGMSIDWLTITDPRESVIGDVKLIRDHPLVSGKVSVYGFLYHVHSGKLEEVMIPD